ncbi:hypothetical protein BUALT_Bualt07G0049800 [Buddleja alternifolia]|uniref:Pectinesterase catalytic domain-containing protein n=1 Tax=Buddleja alternifolia TaxID=168488 RepID=A0AAV6X957_9LAMI|nr:hypothetical protein BUALT_Bualt07G0049800 [Buddleja alternifolia]
MAEVNLTPFDLPSTSGLPFVDIEVDVEVPSVELLESAHAPSRASTDNMNSMGGQSIDVNPGSPIPLHETLPPHEVHMHHIFNWRRVSQILVISIIIIILALSIGSAFMPRKHKRNDGCKISFVVSKNGTSDFRTISKAVEASPSYSEFKICILIQKGEYNEGVNLVMIKLIYFSRGKESRKLQFLQMQARMELVMDGVNGEGFLSRDLTITNLAKEGVAVENWAHHSVFFRCRFVGTNETVQAERKDQLYHSCEFHGRTYLVTGDAAAFFHKCTFSSERSHPKEEIVFTGQSRNLFTSKVGFTFHRCGFYTVDRSINNSQSIFLGSALGDCAVIVVMQSFLDASIGGYFIDTPL